MKDRRIAIETKCENLISWVWEHAYDLDEFVGALKWCGFSEQEVRERAEDEMWIGDCDIEAIYAEA